MNNDYLCFNFFRKKSIFIEWKYFLLMLALVAGFAIRIKFRGYESGDYSIFLSQWYDKLHDEGIHAFENKFSDYNFPYLFLLYLSTKLAVGKVFAIKIPSMIFDFILFFTISRLCFFISNNLFKSLCVSLAVFLAPTVVLNSSMWGQCDSIYTSFVFMSFLSILKKREYSAWVFFAVAFSFKQQAIFFLPVLFIFWTQQNKKFTPVILSFSLLFLLSYFPVAMGAYRSFIDIYLQQQSQYGNLSMNAPSVYVFIPDSFFYLVKGPAILLAVSCSFLLTALFINKKDFSHESYLVFLMACSLAAPLFLPNMHERYFFIFEVACLVSIIIKPQWIYLAAIAQMISFFTYCNYLFGKINVSLEVLSVVLVFTFFFITTSLFKEKV